MEVWIYERKLEYSFGLSFSHSCGQGSFPLSLIFTPIKRSFLLICLALVGNDSVQFLISGYLTFVNLMTVLHCWPDSDSVILETRQTCGSPGFFDPQCLNNSVRAAQFGGSCLDVGFLGYAQRKLYPAFLGVKQNCPQCLTLTHVSEGTASICICGGAVG